MEKCNKFTGRSRCADPVIVEGDPDTVVKAPDAAYRYLVRFNQIRQPDFCGLLGQVRDRKQTCKGKKSTCVVGQMCRGTS